MRGLERACLAIADVSGYTGYLAGVELDHAQDILADLVGTIVEAMAPFRLAKLEGDAAFTYLIGEDIDGSSLQNAIEGTYMAFRSRLRNIRQASTCECKACLRIPDLDLKFVVHHGQIARQQMLGSEELVGPDVILIHRLLKNRVTETTGVNAYALYTQATVDAAQIDPGAQDLQEHLEKTDVAGDVVGWVRDLEAYWQSELARPRREIAPSLVLHEFSWQVPTPPAVTFDYLTAPRLRPLWDTGIIKFDEETQTGRRGVGTTNHCLHGENMVRENILEWRPPHYWMLQSFAVFIPGEPGIFQSDELETAEGGGTKVVSRIGKMRDDEDSAAVFAGVMATFGEVMQASNSNLQALLHEVAAQAQRESTVALPASSGRYLRDPIKG